jgi:hypothetical protein
LCRIFSYAVVIGFWMLPIPVAFLLNLPDLVEAAVILACGLGLVVYIIRSFLVLMGMDMALATLSCLRTARTQYTLPSSRTAPAIRRSIARYGTRSDPTAISPQPFALRYRFSSPWTGYSSGIERVLAVYETELLDKTAYTSIFRSAKANSSALIGRKTPLFLDRHQRKSPLHRVTVLVIFAQRIDPSLSSALYTLVCSNCGDEFENCIIPCVIDLEHNICVFDGMRIPYYGFGYAVKNRGIRIIKNRVFGGNLNLRGNHHTIRSTQDLNPDDTLWDLWGMLRQQYIGDTRKTKRLFQSLAHQELRINDDCLYLKWDQRGICQCIRLDPEQKCVKIESITNWSYPHSRPIGKQLIKSMEHHIQSYYTRLGYCAEFVDLENLL